MDIFNPISLDDPEFFQKLNSARPDLFDQDQATQISDGLRAYRYYDISVNSFWNWYVTYKVEVK